MDDIEMSKLLTQLAQIDPLHSTQSQEKFAIKVDTWKGILGDVAYDHAVAAMQAYYRDPNAKTIKPGILREMALKLTPVPAKPLSGAPDDVNRRERACNFAICRCTHLECYNGFLDEEQPFERNGRTYVGVVRCPTCAQAVLETTGVQPR